MAHHLRDGEPDYIHPSLSHSIVHECSCLDAGGEYPGLLMKNEETGGEMEIRLRAPLFSDKGYSIIVSNHIDHTAIVMQDSPSDDNKRLLSKYLE